MFFYRNGKPGPAILGSYFIAVLKVIFSELNRIQNNKNIGLRNFVN